MCAVKSFTVKTYLTIDLMFLTFTGVGLNPIIVYCASLEDMDNWFGLLKQEIEANGGTAIAPETYTRIRVKHLYSLN